jgi:hypothetical protein
MCGFAANAITYRFYNKQWEQIRAPIQRALAAVPSIKPGTVIMLQDVPVGSAAWGDNFWFDILMRLAYPKTLVAGSYSFDVKKATSKDITNIVRSGGEILQLQNGRKVLAQGNVYVIKGNEAGLLKSYPPTLITSTGIENVIVLKWHKDAPFEIVRRADEIDSAVQADENHYDPDARIGSTGISDIARRRFFQ